MKKRSSFFFGLIAVSLYLILVQSVFAASTKLKINIEGGSLSLISPEAATMSGVALDTSVKTISTSLGELKVTDTRGSGNGWSVTASVTDFACCSNKYNIPSSNLTILPGSIKVEAGNTSGVNAGSSHKFTSTSDIATIISADRGSGMGDYSMIPQLSLDVPINTYAGEYTATLTLTII